MVKPAKKAVATMRMLAPAVGYEMRISRLTVDKLGVKLYDSASAVVAELVANAYDADAEVVAVRLPCASVLARKHGQSVVDNGYTIEVEDDGHGMTPDEARQFYLEVGQDRRRRKKDGARSRRKRRPVMGRKGIGKLAPFGICKRIEVISAGGSKTPNGYIVCHFIMDFDRILADDDKPVPLERGSRDQKYAKTPGTKIVLSDFLPKRVPDSETFHRQLSRRFGLGLTDFHILVQDTRTGEAAEPLRPLSLPLMSGTKVDVADRPVITEEGEELDVNGWVALAEQAYKNEEMAGVRIYARGKIVAVTRDFEQPAGFTGEFTIRSYLVGEVNAEWLDLDVGEDLIRTDRQGILWESEYGRALRTWGADLIRELGQRSRKPRRQKVSDLFLERSQIRQRAREIYADSAVIDAVERLARQIGGFAAEDELNDPQYVLELAEVVLSVAPHTALIEAFQEFNQMVSGNQATLQTMLDLFGKTRIAEMASYSRIAAERVQAIKKLEMIVNSQSDEAELQRLIAAAPWLIEPLWAVISANQQLKTFKASFESWWAKNNKGDQISLAIDHTTVRPDFTLVHIGHSLRVVEIKPADHTFDDTDYERLARYVDAFDAFFDEHQSLQLQFPERYKIHLVADAEKVSRANNKPGWRVLKRDGKVERVSWHDFLQRTVTAHERFLEVRDAALKAARDYQAAL